jgi:hypothetical protein
MLILTQWCLKRIRETPEESERLERKSTGKINRAYFIKTSFLQGLSVKLALRLQSKSGLYKRERSGGDV